MLYRGGELRETSDPLYDDIAPIGRYLDRRMSSCTLAERDEETATRASSKSMAASLLFGYRAFDDAGRPSTVIGAPARADELELGRRRRDLGVLVLVRDRRRRARRAVVERHRRAAAGASDRRRSEQAALSLAGGARTPPFDAEPTVEFSPVFTRVPSNGVGSQREPQRARGSAAPDGGGAAQRGERRRRRRSGRARLARQSARRDAARAAR